MNRILIVLKKENGPRASSAPALGLNTIIFKYVYWHMKQISGERLQDHWSSGYYFISYKFYFMYTIQCYTIIYYEKCVYFTSDIIWIGSVNTIDIYDS